MAMSVPSLLPWVFALAGAVLGTLGCVAAVICRNRLTATRRALQACGEERDLLKRCVTAKPEGIGAESHEALATYFGALQAELAQQRGALERGQSISAASFVLVQDESEQARVVDRKQRFAGYRDTLLNAGLQVDAIAKALRDDEAVIATLLQRLNARRLDPAMGRLELAAIERVLADVEREAVTDLVGELRVKHRKAEFDHTLKFREAMMALEQRLREETLPNPNVARAARPIGEDRPA